MPSFRPMLWTAACTILLSGCGKEPTAPSGPIVRPIKILTVGNNTAQSRQEFPGSLSSAQQAKVAFEVSGRLIELPIEEGQTVVSGQILAKLDPRDFQSALDAAQARSDNAQSQFRRVMELVDRGVASRQEGDNAKQNLDVANADLASARKAFEDTQLRAPFAGQVALVHVENFQNIRAQQSILDLVDINSLEIQIDVPENLIAQAIPNLSPQERSRLLDAKVVVSGVAEREFPAHIKEFAQSADPVTRTYRATFAFTRPDDVNLLPGMTARLLVNQPNTAGGPLRIPARAVTANAGGQSLVWVIDGDMTANARQVQLGQMSGDQIVIVAGLSEGERIAVSGIHQLREGMRVREFQG